MGTIFCDDPNDHRRQGERDFRRGTIDHEMVRGSYDDDCAREYAAGVERARAEQRRAEELMQEQEAHARAVRRREEWIRMEEVLHEAARQTEEASGQFEEFVDTILAIEKARRAAEATARRWKWARSFRAGARFPGSGR